MKTFMSLVLVISFNAQAAPRVAAKVTPAAKPTQTFSAREPANRDGLPVQADRSTSIDFEDDIIEGMNKNPFDSLTRVGKQDGAGGAHLYHRKKGFGREIKQTVREMGYAP